MNRQSLIVGGLAGLGVLQLLLRSVLALAVVQARRELAEQRAWFDHGVDVLATTVDLSPGQVVGREQLEVRRVDPAFVVEGTYASIDAAAGRAPVVPLSRGAFLRPDHFEEPAAPDVDRLKAVRLDDERAATLWGGVHDLYGVLPGAGACLLASRVRAGPEDGTAGTVRVEPALVEQARRARAAGWTLRAVLRADVESFDAEGPPCDPLGWPARPADE